MEQVSGTENGQMIGSKVYIDYRKISYKTHKEKYAVMMNCSFWFRSHQFRQHIIDETGDHFLVVEDNAATATQRKKSRDQLLRSAHYMQGKGRYYGENWY